MPNTLSRLQLCQNCVGCGAWLHHREVLPLVELQLWLLAALAREKAAWRRRVRRREAPRGAYDEWRRGMESDVRACVERIEEIGCSSIEEEVW